MGASRRMYTAEFKAETVRRAMEPTTNRNKLAGELDVGEGVIARWVREHKLRELKQAVTVRNSELKGEGERRSYVRRSDGDSNETRQLREQVAALTEERDALKKMLSHYISAKP